MEITEQESADADTRMEKIRAVHAVSARYDRRRSRIVVGLNNRVEFTFPTQMAEGLSDASPADLAEIEVTPAGIGLYWPRLDVDLYVPALLQGVFGSKRWMAAQLGAAGGRARSEAKTRSSRENGRKGGRPRKVATA